ncbi:hypothetical protein AAVH_29971 [Aphelenchoides avenae]|nr:hypothetical protein AAVH_29971 [Aphelenchus avenae]
MHCLLKPTRTSIQGINEGGVDYFVQFYTPERGNVLNSIWQRIKGMEAHIVNTVFSSRAKNLCTKTWEVITAVAKNALDGHAGSEVFSFAAVRCGYEFVWYQLAYRYFTVGRTAGSNYTLTSRNDNKYNPNCGQIFLFP